MKKISNSEVFKAGNGQIYGLVSMEGSDQVVVFALRNLGIGQYKWVGTCQFGVSDSQGIAPGEAKPEIALQLNFLNDAREERE